MWTHVVLKKHILLPDGFSVFAAFFFKFLCQWTTKMITKEAASRNPTEKSTAKETPSLFKAKGSGE